MHHHHTTLTPRYVIQWRDADGQIVTSEATWGSQTAAVDAARALRLAHEGTRFWVAVAGVGDTAVTARNGE